MFTETLRSNFDRFVRVSDAMVSAMVSDLNSEGAKNGPVLLSSLGMDIVFELEYIGICPNFLRYNGEIFAIDYDNKRVSIVRSISMDDLEVMYRYNVEKRGSA